ncbi:MAG: synthase subunit delta [Evtepia sp.]|jgi:F-type H+-transporting ATPase subunit delta|nr:synthase subunit delta [Evtepia sp.]
MSYLARRYAQALYDTGLKETQFTEIIEVIMHDPVLWDTLLSPVIRSKEKISVLINLPEVSNFPIMLRFLELLTENRRMDLLPEIAAEFHTLTLDEQNVAECVMTCVTIPSEQQQEKLKQMLCKLHHKSEVTLRFIIDPTLLGGFTLTIEGVTYDRSVRGRLNGLSRYLEEVNAT